MGLDAGCTQKPNKWTHKRCFFTKKLLSVAKRIRCFFFYWLSLAVQAGSQNITIITAEVGNQEQEPQWPSRVRGDPIHQHIPKLLDTGNKRGMQRLLAWCNFVCKVYHKSGPFDTFCLGLFKNGKKKNIGGFFMRNPIRRYQGFLKLYLWRSVGKRCNKVKK